jgi:hypothetical protein
MTAGFARSCTIAGVLLVALFPLGSASAESWRIELHKDGIRVSSRQFDGSPIRAIKAETDISAPFARAVALLLDAPMRPSWDEHCVEATVHERVSGVEDVIYVHNDLPWPATDRDMVLRRTWSIAADGSMAQIRAAVADGLLPEVPGRVRVKKADGVWTVLRLDESRVRVSTHLHAEPGGPIPGWLMNRLSIQGPFNALRNIRQLLEAEGYRDAAALPPEKGEHAIPAR